jgi:streptogramin lyase
MFRIAADGYHAADGRWSSEPMRGAPIDSAAVKVYEANVIFRAYGVLSSPDGKIWWRSTRQARHARDLRREYRCG